MTKAEIIRLIIVYLIGHVLGYVFAYIHNAIYDEKILAAVSEQLEIIQRANAEEVKIYHDQINDLNKIIARYHDEHERCLLKKESGYPVCEIDFPNNKEENK